MQLCLLLPSLKFSSFVFMNFQQTLRSHGFWSMLGTWSWLRSTIFSQSSHETIHSQTSRKTTFLKFTCVVGCRGNQNFDEESWSLVLWAHRRYLVFVNSLRSSNVERGISNTMKGLTVFNCLPGHCSAVLRSAPGTVGTK